jgi:DNA-binding NtrC family response regulator
MKPQILIVDDERPLLEAFASILEGEGYEVSAADDLAAALRRLDEREFDLILADIILGGRSGIELLEEVKKRGLKIPVVMITGAPSVKTAAEAVRLGAYDYISKPIGKEAIVRVLAAALKHKALIDAYDRSRRDLEAVFRSISDGIITLDANMKVIEINEPACSFLYTSHERAVGEGLESIAWSLPVKLFEMLCSTIMEKRTGELFRHELSSPNLSPRIATFISTPLLDADRNILGAVLAIRDETHVCMLERDLTRRKRFADIVGKNNRMQKIYDLIESLADVKSTVLITGESGTGKGLVAEAIHYRSTRSDDPFVKVDSAALSDELLESELFGHVRGAFTGAVEGRTGRFQRADGGTVLLDEIGDISPRMQSRLLRIIQDGEFEMVGDSTTHKVDVRIIAATNRNLEKKIKKGEFREDLYYRLKVMEIHIPPLRERSDDIPLLAEHFIRKLNDRMGGYKKGISDKVLKLFMNYKWPGNIRELEHILERTYIVSDRSTVAVSDLPLEIVNAVGNMEPQLYGHRGITPEVLRDALNRTSGNKAAAARLLDVDRRTVYRKIKDFKLKDR